MALSDIQQILGTNNLDEGRIKINDSFTAVKNYLENLTAEQINGLIQNGTIDPTYLNGLTIDEILNRANHTGTQDANTINDLNSAIEDFIENLLTATPINQLNVDAGSVGGFNENDLLDRENHEGQQPASTISDLQSVVNTYIQLLVNQAYINDLNVDAETLAGESSDNYVRKTDRGIPNGVASLDSSAKIPSNQIPPLSLAGILVVKTITKRDEIPEEQLSNGLVVKVTNQITNGFPYEAKESRTYNVNFTATDNGASDGASCDFSITVDGNPVYTETVDDGTSSTISQDVTVTEGQIIGVTTETSEGSVSAVSIITDGGQEKTFIWDGTTWIELTSSADVTLVNGQSGTVNLSTDDIPEGSSPNRKYYNSTLTEADIVNTVTKNFVDNLQINASTLGGINSGNYVRNDITNTINADLNVDGTLDAQTISEGGNPLIPRGIIVMWSGATNTVPSGWALCDGANGTPDLTDKFIVAAGNSYSSGDTGGSGSVGGAPQNVLTDSNGSHDHTASVGTGGAHSHTISINNHTLSRSQMPSHSHSYFFGRSYGADIQRNTGSTGGSGSHSHGASASDHDGHNHSISINSVGDHTHTIDVRPEYFSLAYIMKL